MTKYYLHALLGAVPLLALGLIYLLGFVANGFVARDTCSNPWIFWFLLVAILGSIWVPTVTLFWWAIARSRVTGIGFFSAVLAATCSSLLFYFDPGNVISIILD